MNYYTEDQVKQMLSNSIDQTMGFAENGGIMNEEEAEAIISKSFVHPSTFEIEKQIEAVRGLIVVYEALCKYAHPHSAMVKEMQKQLRTLTAILQPYLNGEKLEV